MTLDKNFKVPEGFEPVLSYRDDPQNGTPIVGLAALKLPDGGNGHKYEFDLEHGAPKLPLKMHGAIWHTGWDIPTRYAIDADGSCWMDNAHGNPLSKVPPERLINDAEKEEQKNAIRKATGLEVPMPEWAQKALSEGWPMPEGWTWKK